MLLISKSPSPPSVISPTMDSKISKQLNNTVTTSWVTISCPSLNLESTSSILWVSSAILVYPIVAAIPLMVCATLKI